MKFGDDMEKDNKQLNEVCTDLKKWSFKSKMGWAQQCSVHIMNPYNILTDITPDEIETYVMLSIKGLEYDNRVMQHNAFRHTIEDIRSFHHPVFKELPDEERIKWIFMTIVSSQLIHQMNPNHLIYRYNYYFSYNKEVNMEDEFANRFGVHYKDVIGPISLLWYALIPDSIIKLSPKGYKWLHSKYEKTIDLITIKRKAYNQQLDQITNNMDDYRYCLRPSFLTPFIDFAGVKYLPTPHLLIISATTSLMYRLTEGNNELRKNIGKYVLEGYLYKIISENSEFDEVLPEQTYGNSQRTLDVLSRIGEDIICFDSKSFTPSIGIKVFSNDALEHIKRILADDICKTYKHIHDKYGVEYSFLSVPIKEDRSNIYAVVVIAEESYIIREEVYAVAAKELGITIPSPEYDWMRGHIGITEISVLEKQLFDRKGIMAAIKRNSETGQYSDFWFFDGKLRENDNIDIDCILNDLWNPICTEATKDNVPLFIGELQNIFMKTE